MINAYVFIYLFSSVAANLSVAYLGPAASVVNALLLIGLDFTIRDRIHDAWSGRRVFPKMALLIIFGSAISYAINRDAALIAVASAVSFFAAGAVDAIVYHAMRRSAWMRRATISNAAASVVDSTIFPSIAFGAFLPGVILGQIAAKILGGVVFAMVLRSRGVRHE